jgi:ribosomal protein S18 acetylase RimI-like enzyme
LTGETRYRLRPERRTDAGFLLDLYADVRRGEMEAAAWPVPQRQAFLRDQLRLQSLHYHRAYPGAEFGIVEVGPLPVGRLYRHESRTDIRIIDLSLLSAYRNRGLGSDLLREVKAQAAARRKTVSLQVAFGNPAMRLYRRFGFRVTDPSDPAHIVMQLAPPPQG